MEKLAIQISLLHCSVRTLELQKLERRRKRIDKKNFRKDHFTWMTREGPPDTISVGICVSGQFSMLIIWWNNLLSWRDSRCEIYLQIWTESQLKGKSVKIRIVIHVKTLQRLETADFLNKVVRNFLWSNQISESYLRKKREIVLACWQVLKLTKLSWNQRSHNILCSLLKFHFTDLWPAGAEWGYWTGGWGGAAPAVCQPR